MKVRIAEVAEQLRGVSYAKADAILESRPGFIPILRANNITNDGLNFDDLVFVPETRVSAKQLLKKGDIVVAASSGSSEVVGKAAELREEFHGAFGAFCKVLRPKNGAVNPAYLAHFFRTAAYRRKISSLAVGANINNLKNEHLDDLEIPLPPVDEQRRIAAILDKADTLRSKRRRALELLDGLTQSIFLEMFGDLQSNSKGWEILSFENVISIDAQMVDPQAPEYAQLLHYGPDRIEKDTGRLLPAQTAQQDGLISGKFLCSAGHILYSKIRPYLNKVALIDFACLCSADVYPVSVKTEAADRVYIAYLLRSKSFLTYSAACSNRANIPKINREQFLRFKSPIPPISHQRAFAKRVARIDGSVAKLVVSMTAMDALFSSLQHRAFSGEL